MKAALLLILLLILSVSSNAQDSLISKKEHRWLQVSLFTTSVITGALGDGLNSRTKYEAGHILSAMSYLSLLSIPIVTTVSKRHIITYIVSYTLIRYSLFDAFYNIGAHRNLNYIGGKNYYDESVGRMPLSVLHGSKIASIGIIILLNRRK